MSLLGKSWILTLCGASVLTFGLVVDPSPAEAKRLRISIGKTVAKNAAAVAVRGAARNSRKDESGNLTNTATVDDETTVGTLEPVRDPNAVMTRAEAAAERAKKVLAEESRSEVLTSNKSTRTDTPARASTGVVCIAGCYYSN